MMLARWDMSPTKRKIFILAGYFVYVIVCQYKCDVRVYLKILGQRPSSASILEGKDSSL
jgi:hypothetical protein